MVKTIIIRQPDSVSSGSDGLDGLLEDPDVNVSELGATVVETFLRSNTKLTIAAYFKFRII